MEATTEIKRMDANELIRNFADVVDTNQNWEEETTTLTFDNAVADVCGGEVSWR